VPILVEEHREMLGSNALSVRSDGLDMLATENPAILALSIGKPPLLTKNVLVELDWPFGQRERSSAGLAYCGDYTLLPWL
jgi:hypothetical protein